MIRLKDILNEGKKYKFLGMCDKVRSLSDANEEYWHKMIAKRKKISNKQFIQLSDVSSLLDDEEDDINDFFNDNKRQDSSSASYKSIWNKTPCTYYQTAGFEYIFVK